MSVLLMERGRAFCLSTLKKIVELVSCVAGEGAAVCWAELRLPLILTS
jgi:hypothetical protein